MESPGGTKVWTKKAEVRKYNNIGVVYLYDINYVSLFICRVVLDGFSTFVINSDGQIFLHRMDKVCMKGSEPQWANPKSSAGSE